ncbi:nucleotidyltransferase AbiEii toxin of type IV toxin-antitoxin system [Kribbella orskensis]|uniref:Nucleotidyltransferase AbiEii toxin of type IV toxin-antitoxin system n=1 Tax=Kribbella orskensis TaxID=2512216 RepID=A0ABY2BAU3_9ACTN|nr:MULTISPECIES: nucleotidyl transferase AbiEii/AbiGii toxin family protein [Kribbella]TCN33584.1 nucleotidyltransferase AbiEii toxin of type IV toxin-antitoxin system [Kribbella sp. VKM Ac-2500]TCO14009.1 nucleotidyltransferase AbiEii toxin of type IV toxin-antitoxin system [Kribbella orskensis]
MMDPDHEKASRIALSAIEDRGFALAGGHALTMHGIGSRQAEDIDLFTDRQTDFGQAVTDLRAAYAEQSYQVEVPRLYPEYARLELTKDGRTTQLDIGRDYRTRPPVETEVGPVLSADDAVGSKVSAVYGRGDAKDYVDLSAAAWSGRYTRDELMALGDEREASSMDRDMFAEQLSAATRIPDAKYAECGLGAQETAALKHDMAGWAQELRTRAENPDLDNALRLTQTGQTRPGHGQAAEVSAEAARRHSPYEQERGSGEREH